VEPLKVLKTLEEVKTSLRNLCGEFLEFPTLRFLEKLRFFEFSLISLRTVNEFTTTPSFWGHLSDAVDGGFFTKGLGT
jgi:hypothetical protein